MRRIGVIPAAGKAKRLPFLPCSKEIFPIGFMNKSFNGTTELIPKPIIINLIEYMVIADIEDIVIIINNEKTDIIKILGNGNNFGVNITYQFQEDHRGMPFALNLPFPWIKESIVLFGMPDTIFSPPNAFRLIVDKLIESNSDITLGLFPTDKPEKFGMVDYDKTNGNFIYAIDKPPSSNLKFMWGIACWGPRFSEHLRENVLSHSSSHELVFSTVIQNAYNKGLLVNVVPFSNGEYIDIGTPDDLLNAIVRFNRLK